MAKFNQQYRYHIKLFLEWLDERKVDKDTFSEYAAYLKEHVGRNGGTARAKYCAAVNYVKSENLLSTRQLVEANGWAQYLHSPIADKSISAYHCTDSEIEQLIKAASRRTALYIKAIRECDLKVTQLVSLKVTDSVLPPELHMEVQDVFQSDKWLFCTHRRGIDGYKRQQTRNFVTREIAKLGKRVLGKTISAESIREGAA